MLWVLLAAALAALLPCARPEAAHAEVGSLTVAREGDDAAYEAYPILYADVTAEGVGTHFAWPDGTTRDTLLEALDAEGYEAWLGEHHPGDDQHDLAQNAAAFLSQLVGDSADTLPQGSPPERSTKGQASARIARALVSDAGPESHIVGANDTLVGEQGLWLLVSAQNDDGMGAGHTGTEPLWVVLGPEHTTVTEKVGSPTLTKQVRDAGGTWTSVAGIGAGETRTFRLTATLPENLAAFDHYLLRFEDRLAKGTVLAGEVDEVVRVLLDEQPVAIDGTHLAVSLSGSDLSVELTDLKDPWWDDAGISADTTVTIEYPVRITGKARSTATGNPNEARIVYTNDPTRLTSTSSPMVRASLMTWRLRLLKIAGDGKTPLAGARFTVARRLAGGGEGSASYVQGDGSLGKRAHEFSTGRDGQIDIHGLDDGTYVITEVEAPKGYQLPAEPIELTVASQLDRTRLVRTKLEAKTTSGGARLTKVDADEGLVELRVTNEPVDPGDPDAPEGGPPPERLAQTGVGPLALVLFGLGALALLASRNRGTPS